MKFAVASYGTRGDIEPCLTIGRELMRRGHSVRMAVPPNLVDLAEEAGVPAIPYGPDMHDFWSDEFIRDFFKNFIRGPVKLMREAWEPVLKNWQEMSAALMSVGAGADLLFTGQLYQDLAINVADYYGIPMATLHYIPMRPNGRVVPGVPAPMVRTGMAVYDWMCWRMNKKAEDRQRRELGLPTATVASPRRIAERGSLEIQAYDDVCFPGLADEWAKWGGQRPFVGSLTMELTTECDDEVLAWIAQGTPPICFGFGSMPVAESPADTVRMIGAACAELGERGVDLFRLERLQRRPPVGPRQGRRRGQLHENLSRLSRGRSSRRLGHYGRRPARGDPFADPLDGRRPADVGLARQATEGRHIPTVLERHPRNSHCRSADDPCPGVHHPRP